MYAARMLPFTSVRRGYVPPAELRATEAWTVGVRGERRPMEERAVEATRGMAAKQANRAESLIFGYWSGCQEESQS